MDVTLHTGELAGATHDLLALGVFERELKGAIVAQLDRALGGALVAAMGDEHFEGKDRQVLILHTLGKLRHKRVAVLGLGKRKAAGEAVLVGLGARAASLGLQVGAVEVLLVPAEAPSAEAIALLARGAVAGGYAFDKLKSDKGKKHPPRRLAIHASSEKPAPLRTALSTARAVARAVSLARDLVNEPAMGLYPESLAQRARAVAREFGLGIKVLAPAELEKLGMRLILGVGAGSSRPPRLVHLTYQRRARPRRAAPLVLVGKGITFDSGGLSLKAAANMEDMKSDMAGAAAVLATMQAVAELEPDLDVHGILALAENMPSGTAIRPGDVIRGAAGKTVEINNTDAEGRLVLADALHYARGLSPRAVVDVATLTGACVVALGPHTVGVFGNDDALVGRVLAAAKASGESFWRMPLTAELRDQLKSEVADMRNTGGREGGAITAALFLSEFVGETPWVHLDIAGPALAKQNRAGGKGATGVAVATLVALATSRGVR